MTAADPRRPQATDEAGSPVRSRRRATIVSEATRLFQERGYETTSVNDLAATLDMSVGGLYRYIETKSDLLVMVCESIYGDLPTQLASIADLHAAPTQRLVTLFDTYLRSCVENRRLILLMYREYRHLPEPARERFKQREEAIAALFQRVVDEGIAAGEFAAEIDGWSLAHDLVLIGHLPALKGWALRGSRRTANDAVDHQIRLIFQALGVRGRLPDPRERPRQDSEH